MAGGSDAHKSVRRWRRGRNRKRRRIVLSAAGPHGRLFTNDTLWTRSKICPITPEAPLLSRSHLSFRHLSFPCNLTFYLMKVQSNAFGLKD